MMDKKEILKRVRLHCLACDNAKKLVYSHCENEKCDLYAIRKEMIEASQQLCLFTYAGFKEACENIIKFYDNALLDKMFFSDIREFIESKMKLSGEKVPDGKSRNSWWGKIAVFVLPKCGWRRNQSQYRYTKEGGQDYLYERAPFEGQGDI